MSARVESSTSNGNMVKPQVTRKSRQFQTAVERWSILKQNSTRSFDRLNLRNKFEDECLLRKHKDISDISDTQLRDVFRVKNEMRVTLIDIAKSKRHYSSRESDFESRLRTGKQSPIFQMEYRRLRSKQVELGKLCEQLKGPNSALLASNLTTELKNVETRSLKDAKKSKYKSKWLAPLKALPKSLPADDGETQQGTEPTTTDFANMVKMVHKQFKKASISGGKDTTQNLPSGKNANESTQESIETKKSLPDIPKKNHNLEANESSNSLDVSPREESESKGKLPSASRPPKALIPIASAISLLEIQEAASSETANLSSAVGPKRKRRQRKDTEQSLPSVPEASESPFLTEPDLPQPPKPPKSRRSKKQKAQSALVKSMQNYSSDTNISRTESARRRDKLMKKRLSDLAIKTKEDIANRRSISPHDEALNSIHQAEVVARLQLVRSKVGIKLPELRKEKKSPNAAARRSKGQSSVSLPPVNIEGKLLRELKEQRRKHRNQSTGLPKLP